MKKLFFIDGGAGRAIASIPAFLKYAKKHDDFGILVYGWDSLYWGISELQDNVFNPEQKGIFDQVVKDAEEIISPEPYRVPGYFKQELSLAEAFDVIINNTDDHSDLQSPILKTSKGEEVNAAKLILDAKAQQQKDKTIVIQPFGRSMQRTEIDAVIDESSRSLDSEVYLKLVKKLATKYNLVLMAEQPFHSDIDTYTIKPNADLRLWAAFIDAADYFVGVDSVGQHMARALGKPGTVIIGSTFAVNTTYPDYFNIWERKVQKKYSPIRISGLEGHLADRLNEKTMELTDEEVNQLYQSITKDIEKKVK